MAPKGAMALGSQARENLTPEDGSQRAMEPQERDERLLGCRMQMQAKPAAGGNKTSSPGSPLQQHPAVIAGVKRFLPKRGK